MINHRVKCNIKYIDWVWKKKRNLLCSSNNWIESLYWLILTHMFHINTHIFKLKFFQSKKDNIEDQTWKSNWKPLMIHDFDLKIYKNIICTCLKWLKREVGKFVQNLKFFIKKSMCLQVDKSTINKMSCFGLDTLSVWVEV